MKSVAVAILNFNGEKLLRQFLPTVVEHSSTAKIIVIDNGSSDGSISWIESNFPQVKLIQLKENLGYCGGYNTALSQISEEIVVLLNSDVEVTQGWLQSPVQLLQSQPNIAAVQPKILSYYNKVQFEYAGAAGGFIDLFGYPFCRGRIFNSFENDKGQYNERTEIFWASGACLFIKREKYQEVGGLDEDFFAHMEEIDLAWRLLRSGYSIYYDGHSTVHHLGGGTLSTRSPKKIFFNFKNNLSLLLKNLPNQKLAYLLPLRIILDWTAAINFLFQGFGRSSLAVFKAHLYFLIGLRNDLSKRRRYSHLSFHIKPGLILNKSIVVEHFLIGRSSYNEIKNPR